MKKDKIIVSIVSILIFASFCAFLVGMKLHNSDSFKLYLETKENNLSVSFKENRLASIYEIIIKNDNEEIIYKETTSTTNIDADFTKDYKSNYYVTVRAFNDSGKEITTSETTKVVWNKPTFDKTKDYTSSNYYYYLDINGKITNDLKISYYLEDEKIITTDIDNNKVAFPREVFTKRNTLIKAILHNDNEKMDEIFIKINQNAIEQITILSPESQKEYYYDSLLISLSGGRGSSEKTIYIYEEDELIYQTTITGSSASVSRSYFNENVMYKLIVKGSFNKYDTAQTSTNVSFWMVSKNKVNPVYASNYKYVNPGTAITLKSKSKDCTIKYTLDGTKPSLKNGIVYSEPIVINEKTNIKAIAINNEKVTSEITSFEFIPEFKNIAIYISPSRQVHNIGVSEVGYTTEAAMMNKLADLLIPKLEARGYIIYRNNPETDIMTWAAESNKNKVDLHLALHSNGSVLHDESGVKTYIDEESNATYSLANIIQDSLVSVYYDKDNKNNSISYAKGRLGEVRPSLIPFGILLEIGYHDDYNDAFWIVNNMNNIAIAIANGLDSYFGY